MESASTDTPPDYRGSLVAAAIFALLFFLLYFDTAASMVAIWSRSDTFAHGFLILPITLWLIWQQRAALPSSSSRPAPRVLLLMLPPAAAWVVAWLVGVAVIQQFSMVAILLVGLWAVLGHRMSFRLAFPLLFLFFAVPIGEGLVAPMMEFTATSTIWLIKLIGIPVYREGLHFALPTGRWSVVEACSGVRYIIASVTVGVLYAYLTYRSWYKRALFIVVSAIVPVFANTARAFIIVMLGHSSNMQIATGADHLIYGWVFFGIVLFILFWLGSFFREEEGVIPVQSAGSTPSSLHSAGRTALIGTVLLALIAAAIAPLLARTLLASEPVRPLEIAMPAPSNNWQLAPDPDWEWSPASYVAGLQTQFYHSAEGELVTVFVQYANGTNKGADVIGSSSLFTMPDTGTRVIVQATATAQSPQGDVVVKEVQTRGPDGELLVWSWYTLGDLSTSSAYRAKIYEAIERLQLHQIRPYRILLVTPLGESAEQARGRLQAYLDEQGPRLYNGLQSAGPVAP